MSRNLRKEAIISYQKINQQWLKFQYHMLLICVTISALFEIVMYFIIRYTGMMYETDLSYWLKYIISPILIGFILSIFAFITIKHKRLKTKAKAYIVSILMMLVATNLSFVHSGYEAILFAFLLPILMTIMYEDQYLTALITTCTVPLEIYTALSMYWDPYKEITHGFLVNLLIIVVLTIVTWLVSYYMIRFSHVKKRFVIAHDVERQQLKARVLLDELTNVGTKSALYDSLNILMSEKSEFHLMMIDIDDFKEINDQHGHLYGDEVLRSLGHTLNQMRPQCSCFRYGGDEFCVLMQDTRKEYIMLDIQNLQKDFVETLRSSKRTILSNVTLSIGVAKYHEEMEAKDLIKRADDALYESKKQSKNTMTYKA